MKYLAVCYNLKGCEVFHQVPEEVIDREWNGLGPDRLPERIRAFLDNIFTEVLPAACIHDLRYVIGGSKDDFYAANRELAHNMRVCIRKNRKKFTFLGYWMARLRIRIAISLCNAFGWEGWNKT